MGSATIVSSDGTTWAVATTPVSNFTTVAWGGGQLVALASDGRLATSPDGLVWRTRPSLPATFVGINWLATNGITWLTQGLKSSDSVTWSDASAMPYLVAVTWTGTEFVGVGGGGSVATSTDGLTWKLLSADPAAIASNGSSYVIAEQPFMWSNDGATWTLADPSPTMWPTHVVAYPGGYLALGIA